MSRAISYDFKAEIPNKRMKRSVVDGIVVNITPRKKIVDINYDCLESVFNFLDISDLINVAEANKHLKVVAEMVFARKVMKRMIIVQNNWSLGGHPYIRIFDNAIRIRVPLLGFKIIRLFGQHISELYVRIVRDRPLRKSFFIHANEYCHKTLNILHVYGNHSDIFGAAKNPFEMVEKFTYQEGPVGRGCEHFNRLFPRLRQLTLKNNDVLDSIYILQAFPNLDTFTSYYSLVRSRANCFMNNDLDTIATLNPQLKSFTLKGFQYIDPQIWEPINENLKNLKSIHISFSTAIAARFKGAPISFNNVETCVVYSRDYPVPRTVNPIDVFVFKRLKKITVTCAYDNLEMWLDFVQAHPTIEELEISYTDVYSWPVHLETLENSREKLNKLRQNLKFISIRYNDGTFEDGHIKEIPTFLENQQWFDKFSVKFVCHLCSFMTKVSSMDDLCAEVPQIKNYKMKKHSYVYHKTKYMDICHELCIDFEKCES